jgi:hypothetical protein
VHDSARTELFPESIGITDDAIIPLKERLVQSESVFQFQVAVRYRY